MEGKFYAADIAALELLWKAGKIDPAVPWVDAVPQVRDYIRTLAAEIQLMTDLDSTE